MDEFYKRIQMLLMRKNQECGELRCLFSRSTAENTQHIDDICKSIMEIFRDHDIPMLGEYLVSNERCVKAFKYLLLNTNFASQERLAEDVHHGHLVDMCPPLSPYVFMQVVWCLGYERVLLTSLLYMPLDVCSEMQEILRKCIEELPFERAIEIIYQLVFNLYSRFIRLRETGAQSANLARTVEYLLASFQETLLLLENPNVTRLEELTGLRKHERYGLMLKRLIQVVKNCFEMKTEACPSEELEALYIVNFGREPTQRYDDASLVMAMATLDGELLNLLLTKAEEITCNIYLAWVELDDAENKKISLQRSIGIDCFYFVELMKGDSKLSEQTDLIECLQALSSKPDSAQSGYVLSLQELCHFVEEGKEEHLKELLSRYREWDRPILDFIESKKSLLEKEDCLDLLDYLTFVVRHSEEEELKQASYVFVTRTLLQRAIPDIYEIVLKYLMKYDGRNYLESRHTEEAFKEIIQRNANLRTPRNLRIILLFLLKNPRLVLGVLLKIAIGHPDYQNVLIAPNDMLLLAPFLRIKEENNQTLLMNLLREMCTGSAEWKSKRFMDFVQAMLDSSTTTVDTLMNCVFIPYLQTDMVNLSNMNSILNNIRKLQGACTKNTNAKALLVALASRMSSLRKDTLLSKYLSSEVFAQMVRILEKFLDDVVAEKAGAPRRRDVIEGIVRVMEPIDKLHFGVLWQVPQSGDSVVAAMEDYERRCSAVVAKMKEDARTPERLRNYLESRSFHQEDFIRHLITRATQAEHRRLGSELTILFWFMFGWGNEAEACANFLRLGIEACCLALEFPTVGPRDLFVFLLKCILSFCRTLTGLERMNAQDAVLESLIQNVKSLEASIGRTVYAGLFRELLARLDSNFRDDSQNQLKHALDELEEFANRCTKLGQKEIHRITDSRGSPRVHQFYLTHQLISACMVVPAPGAFECIVKMNELFDAN